METSTTFDLSLVTLINVSERKVKQDTEIGVSDMDFKWAHLEIPKEWIEEMPRSKTEYIVIHCTATRPSQDIDVRTIDRWHRERGFEGRISLRLNQKWRTTKR